MDRQEILKKVDHTLLAQTATWEEIKEICDDAIKYQTASICIPPSYVKEAKAYVQDQMEVCTVIGFPNGYNTTAVKKAETEDALKNGADEIDMVINIGWVKDKKFAQIEEEIRTLKKACGTKILKVIIETCLLTEEEKIRLCEIVTASGALFAKHVGKDIKIKAAGGISSFEDAEEFVRLGADRLGTSRLVKIRKES